MAVSEAEGAQCVALFSRLNLLRAELDRSAPQEAPQAGLGESTYALWERPLRPAKGLVTAWSSAPSSRFFGPTPAALVPYVLLRRDIPAIIEDIVEENPSR